MKYLGQVVTIPEEDGVFGIIVGEDIKEPDNKWVFMQNRATEEYDAYAFDVSDLENHMVSSKSTMSGKSIYHGPFCKFTFTGGFSDRTLSNMASGMIKELKSLSRKSSK